MIKEIAVKFVNQKLVENFVNTCHHSDCTVDIKIPGSWIDGKSVLGILGLDLSQQYSVRINGESEQVEQLVKSITEVLTNGVS